MPPADNGAVTVRRMGTATIAAVALLPVGERPMVAGRLPAVISSSRCRLLLAAALQLLQSATVAAEGKFVKVETGTCASNNHLVIESKPDCIAALQAIDHLAQTWGPNGGYPDVTDGCSIRGKNQLFCNNEKTCVKGTLSPYHPKGATCDCTALQPCLCYQVHESKWGQAVLLLFFLVGGAYGGAGIALGKNKGRAGSIGAHVHFEWWVSVHGLCRDGAAFAGNGMKRPATKAASSHAGGGGGGDGGGSNRSGGGAELPSTKEKKDKKEKKEKKEKLPSMPAGSHPDAAGKGGKKERFLAEPEPAAAATAAAAGGTTAGGGGRWVHVPT